MRGLAALFVCTPQTHHLDVVQAAIDRQMPVFGEKPIADSLTAADDLIRSVAATSAIVVVGHLRRFEHRHQAILAAVAAGEVGVRLKLLAGARPARVRGSRCPGAPPS